MSKKLVLLNQIFLFNAVWPRIIFIVPVLLSSCQFFSNEDRQQSLVYLPVLESQKKPLVGSEPFRLIDQFSTAHAINNYKDKKSIFLIYINKACFKLNEKIILNSLPSFAELELQGAVSVPLFITKGVGETYGDYQHIKTPVLFDDFQFVTKAYGLSEVGSFVEIQMSDNQVLNRGKIPLANNTSLCSVEAEAQKNSPVTFTKVQSVFASQCMRCHQQNEAHDYFKTMSSVQKWSKMMLKTMQTYRMPPGGVDTKLDGFPQYGKVRHEELFPLYKWLEEGAVYSKEDEVAFLKLRSKVRERTEKDLNFQGRKPDFKFKMSQADEIPATGEPYFVRSHLAGPFAEDTYLEAAQFEVSKNVTHHARIFLHSKKIKKKIIRTIEDLESSESLSAPELKTFSKEVKSASRVVHSKLLFVYGSNLDYRITSFERGSAVFIPKGSYLIIENHYEPNGINKKNQAVVSFYKYKKKELPKKIIRFLIFNSDFALAPNQSNLDIHSILPIKTKAQLIAVAPHIHYRGKYFKLFLKKQGADSDLKLVYSAPFLLFKFPAVGAIEKSINLNPGDELHIIANYDNSVMNIGNPDPSKKIESGLSELNDEMYHIVLFFRW